MEFGQIQNTDIRPSRIGLGTWAIGGWKWGGADDAAVATIHRALDSGINLIDTAPAYGQGHSEEIVGRAIQGRRERVVVATKVALEWDERGEPWRNASASRIRKEIDDSLARLQTDYVDIYQVHWPDPATPMEETAKGHAGALRFWENSRNRRQQLFVRADERICQVLKAPHGSAPV